MYNIKLHSENILFIQINHIILGVSNYMVYKNSRWNFSIKISDNI